MKRRRGDLSLFEILREPTETSPPNSGNSESGNSESGKSRISEGQAAPQGAENEGGSSAGETAHGSTTPPAPESKPRLDVTPPSRSSRIAAARSDETPGARRGLPPLDPQLTSTDPQRTSTEVASAEAGSEPQRPTRSSWWNEPIAIRPPVLLLAGIGVLLVGLVAYKSGASSADERNARFSGWGGLDAAEWSGETIQAHGMPKPEVRRIVDEDGPRPEAGALGDNQVLPVILVASNLGADLDKDWGPVEALILYLENKYPDLTIGVTLLGGQYAVYVGPFHSMQGARDVIPRVQSLKKWRGTSFRDAYIRDLEFTPADLEKQPPL